MAGVIEPSGGKRRTVKHNEAGSRDDEEHHDEACVALAGFALGPGVVYDLLVASEQVSHHNVRHICVWCWSKWVVRTAARFSKANDRRPLDKIFLFTGKDSSSPLVGMSDVKAEVKRDLKTVAGHPRMQISLQKMKNNEIVV